MLSIASSTVTSVTRFGTVAVHVTRVLRALSYVSPGTAGLVEICAVILAVVAGALLAGQGASRQHITRVDLTLSVLGPVGTVYISVFTGYSS